MRQVIVNMKDFVFADAVAQALRNDNASGFAVQNIGRPEEIIRYCSILSPYVLLMEVTRYEPYTLEERLYIAEHREACHNRMQNRSFGRRKFRGGAG